MASIHGRTANNRMCAISSFMEHSLRASCMQMYETLSSCAASEFKSAASGKCSKCICTSHCLWAPSNRALANSGNLDSSSKSWLHPTCSHHWTTLNFLNGKWRILPGCLTINFWIGPRSCQSMLDQVQAHATTLCCMGSFLEHTIVQKMWAAEQEGPEASVWSLAFQMIT